MYVDIEYLNLIKFQGCIECVECCKKPMAPLILEDFEKVYEHFPILIAKLDVFKPVMLLSNEEKCPYLKNGKCSIYDTRPPACKIYPYSPWYDKILIDLSCPGIGIKGKKLPCSKTEFINSDFYEERFDRITEKLNKTLEWTLQRKFTYLTTAPYGIQLFFLTEAEDFYSDLILKSYVNLSNYAFLQTNNLRILQSKE